MHNAEFASQNAEFIFSDKTPSYPLKPKQAPIQQVFPPVAQSGEAGDGYFPRVAARPASKRVFDICMALLLLMVLAPLLFLVALAVRLDSPGPVLFKQPRLGLDDEVFWMWKFRSMYFHHSDVLGIALTVRNDSRITRIGALIRKTSIDELPQLFNVLAGDMSLIGPRPHAIQAKVGTRLYPEVVPNYYRRHLVRPGITGWAQVNGWRGETVTDEQIKQRVAHDLYYIDKQSFWFDLKILFLTLSGLWRHDAF